MNDSSIILDSSDKIQAFEALLSSATAETLTLSDQHVSFLLTRQKGDEDSNASGTMKVVLSTVTSLQHPNALKQRMRKGWNT